jgi:CheY-like chemotaxis protein
VDPVQVLVVEDDELIRAWLQGALEEGGYAPWPLASGEEALARLEADGQAISALVTDVDLGPGRMSGWDLARRAREITPAMPVIYSTGGNAEEWPSRGVPNSVLLQKPFAEAQLTTAVSQLLNAAVPPPTAPG